MENPNQEIGSIDLCNNRDITQIQQWNSSPVDTVESCIHELIGLQAINYPDAPAVHSWDDKFSYQRLDNLSSRLAQHLLSLGVGPEVFVPFYIEKSAWAVVAILSILKAGGAFVPIDLGQPLSRLEEIVGQVSAKVLFVSPQGPSSVPGIESIIQVSPAMEQWLPEATALSHVKVKPSNASYIMFTSGSTGKPKGVIMEHAAASTSMVGQLERMRFGPTTRAFQFASFSFDVSLLEILTPLIHGGCVCMPSERERVDSLAQAMTAMDVNWSCMTNTVARLLRPDDVPCLETMFCGGEKVTEDVSQKWAPKLNFNQGYGPTEACIVCTMRPMPPGRNDVHNIGTSISSLSWVVHKDDHHCLLPVGSIGELLVEGPILARGYLNDPDKTANAFIENPAWTVEKGAPVRPRRLYKTGDLVKYNEDGSLTIVGRKDRQVKLHGQRIEPGEIEFQLRQVVSMAAGVDAEVAVEIITTADQRAQQLLAAFIHIFDERKSVMSEPSLGAGPWPLVGEVKARLLDLLPKHMVPSAYIPINNMPMTTSGKLDRAYLRQIGARLSVDKLIGYMGVTRNYRAPISSEEKDLQLLWSEVLAVDANTIGAEDNFFTLGGDSLLAIKMVSLARTHGLTLTFEGIFNNAQLSDMALTMGVLDDLPAETVENFLLVDGFESKETIWEEIISQCGVKAEEVEDYYMTTPTQDEGMRSHIIDPRVWVGKYAYEIPAEYDIGRFRSAWEDVVASNAILRTRFVKLDSVRSVQVVLKETIKWGHGDSLDGYFRHVASLALGFGKPLAHYAIINDVNTGAKYFLWVLHHGLYDGWSVSKLYEQVSRRYHGEAPAPLPGFKFFVKYLLEKDNRASDDFWRDQLSNVTPPHFPLYPSASFYPITTGRVQLNLDLPHRPGSQTTAAMIIQAAWAMVLAEYEQRVDVVFGSSVAGRNEPVRGIESLIGPTMTIVPFHLRVEYNQTAKEFLERVKKKAIAMIPFQQRGLSSIRALSADARAACDIRTYLIVAPFDMTDSFPGLRKVTGQYQQAQQAPFPVVVQCKINREGVLIGIGFDERVTSCKGVS
jgi:amino acid adenylation domain-containing protein